MKTRVFASVTSVVLTTTGGVALQNDLRCFDAFYNFRRPKGHFGGARSSVLCRSPLLTSIVILTIYLRGCTLSVKFWFGLECWYGVTLQTTFSDKEKGGGSIINTTPATAVSTDINPLQRDVQAKHTDAYRAGARSDEDHHRDAAGAKLNCPSCLWPDEVHLNGVCCVNNCIKWPPDLVTLSFHSNEATCS